MRTKGFTLIEVMVSVAIFSIVMTVALGALLAMSESDRRAEALKSVVNNLDFALDSMSRVARTSSDWRCGLGQYVPCPNSEGTAFRAYVPKDTIYTRSTSASVCGNQGAVIGCIARSTDGGVTYLSMTSPEVVVTTFKIYLIGNALNDGVQPKVTFLISGYINLSSGQPSPFTVQTTATQRIYDI